MIMQMSVWLNMVESHILHGQCRDATEEPFMVSLPYLADWALLPHHTGNGMTTQDGGIWGMRFKHILIYPLVN
jgi:hypothetical protein